VAPPTAADISQRPLEILDTGTGHGAVTLHLARAIQAANPPIPELDVESSDSSSESISDDSSARGMSTDEDDAQVWKDWRANRRAIVHSVEISPAYSRHAEKKVVAGFRRGLYSPHIDFHVANVSDWIDRQLKERDHESFLSYVFLDMPSCHRYLGKIATAMKEDALIAVFVPSITQIAECVRDVKAKGLLLRMEKVLELGDGISNGRLWDVRLAFKKANDPIDESNSTGSRNSAESESNQEEADQNGDIAPTSAKEGEDEALTSMGAGSLDGIGSEAPVMVCRPKVGERVIGGGFVALWRRKAL
jgi:tRNA methyltransferase complex GCD14 subunit